jgi:uncharacterized membrane protein YbhN (UPF0104 family)
MFAVLKDILALLKPYLRWAILGGTIFFLGSTLLHHWHEVAALQIAESAWRYGAIALALTLFAFIWSGWVWGCILRELRQPVAASWSVPIYLKTNIAKYLPGNVWHFYGRVVASKNAGYSLEAAALSVVMEPLLMAAAALMLALIGWRHVHTGLTIFSLMIVLLGLHPQVLNFVLQRISRLKQKFKNLVSPDQIPYVRRYPLRPLLGEMCFLVLRGGGFLMVAAMFGVSDTVPVLPLLSAFSFSWLLGLVVPGAPGGLGVFEASMIALMENQIPVAALLGAVALYRLVSTLAEGIGAGLAYLYSGYQERSTAKSLFQSPSTTSQLPSTEAKNAATAASKPHSGDNFPTE